MLAVASSTSTPQRTDEDLINRSLLDSIDADHQAELSSTSHRQLDPSSVPYPYLPRAPSPPPVGRMTLPGDPFAAQDDIKRAFGRAPYSPFGPVVNTAVGGQPSVLSGPYRESAIHKYQVPTAADIYGAPELQRVYDYREPSRDYSAFHINKSLTAHHGMYSTNAIVSHGQGLNGFHHHREEEISTIFVVGFPDDMQEREFQNMFTFAKGFEAASLKIPHKEHSAHNGINGSHQNGYPASAPYGTQEFNVVTPGAIGMDQPNSGWPAPLPEEHFNPPPSHSQRKQIIGFAKFRTRAEALEARDFLQGRKVDVDRGAMLKAEMAKKNLHTKRGPGPSGLPLSMVGPGGMVGPDTLASLTGLPGGAAGLPSQASGEAMRDRERELGTLGAMGFIGPGSTRHRDKDLERESLLSGSSRMRFGTSDSETENEPVQHLRNHNQVAFDAFHAVPTPQNSIYSARSVLSPTESISSRSPGKEPTSYPMHLNGNGVVHTSPWGTFSASSHAGSSRNSSPETDVVNFASSFTGLKLSTSPPLEQQGPRELVYSSSSEQLNGIGGKASHPVSSASSASGAREADDEMDTARFQASGLVSESAPDSPPEITSPPGRMNSSDQNPPINTLYVGNLPTSPPPGSSPTHLEDNLRNLFESRPGYRKLCFRMKDNGPMCFVEFDDVAAASKALNELYGNQLNGLVKTGIRLSYSKNPLGVRTGGSQLRLNGYQHNNSWSTGSNLNGSESKFHQPTAFPPLPESNALRTSEIPVATQRSVVINEAGICPTDLTSNSAPYSLSSQPSRFFSPPPFYISSTPLKYTNRSSSMFSPFQSTDTILTPVAREQAMQNLTPSPGIESARAG